MKFYPWLTIFLTAGFTSAIAAEDSGKFRNNTYDRALNQLKEQEARYAETLRLAPKTYSFESKLGQGESVSYAGQAFRQLLIEELKSYIDSLKVASYPGSKDDALAALNSYYAYDAYSLGDAFGSINGFSQIKLIPKNIDGIALPIAEGSYFDDIQANGKQLQDKTAGNDNPLRRGELKGWVSQDIEGINLSSLDVGGEGDGIVEPEDLVAAWLQVIARNAAEGEAFQVPNGTLDLEIVEKAYVTPEGLDLAQLVQKFLHGAVSFSQAAEDYLSQVPGSTKGLNASNDEPYSAASNFTKLEHHWDEAYGYYGASVSYKNYDLKQIASKRSLDTNQDGSISLLSEYNFGLAVNAAKRDLGSKSKTDFTNSVMDSFLKGRHMITVAPEGYRDFLKNQSVYLLGQWEKVIAATVVHYINETVAQYGKYGSKSYSFTKFAKVWSEMKGFALAMQFSPVAILSDDGFDRVHELFGDRPTVPHADSTEVNTYVEKLLEARDIFQQAYQFSPTDVKNW